MFPHPFTPRLASEWEAAYRARLARQAYARLTRWIAGLAILFLLGTLMARLHAQRLALPAMPAAYERPASPNLYEADTTDL